MTKIVQILILSLSWHGIQSQAVQIDTLQFNGAIDKRINLVILGDGYQNHELPKFSNDAINFTNAFFRESPMTNYQNFFNVFSIPYPSEQSGASHPGTATDVTEPVHPVMQVNNYFGSTFDAYSIHRLLVSDNSVNITNILADNFPLYDQVIILVNSPYYGGSGGNIPTASTHPNSNEIANHELGHSFTNLADEYYAGDVYAREAINMTMVTDPSAIKWKNWLGDYGIGIYQHCCGGMSMNWYKPHEACKMQALGRAFCSVCSEGIIEKIHKLVCPIDGFFPLDTILTDVFPPIIFSLNLIELCPNSLKVRWNFNSEEIAINVDSVKINEEMLIAGNNYLSATVEDTTELLRVDDHSSLHIYAVTWSIQNSTTGLSTINTDKFDLKMFPNPIEGILNVELENYKLSNDTEILISDLNGRKRTKIKAQKSLSINLDFLESGTYIFQLLQEDHLIASRKIVKM